MVDIFDLVSEYDCMDDDNAVMESYAGIMSFIPLSNDAIAIESATDIEERTDKLDVEIKAEYKAILKEIKINAKKKDFARLANTCQKLSNIVDEITRRISIQQEGSKLKQVALSLMTDRLYYKCLATLSLTVQKMGGAVKKASAKKMKFSENMRITAITAIQSHADKKETRGFGILRNIAKDFQILQTHIKKIIPICKKLGSGAELSVQDVTDFRYVQNGITLLIRERS